MRHFINLHIESILISMGVMLSSVIVAYGLAGLGYGVMTIGFSAIILIVYFQIWDAAKDSKKGIA